MLNFMPIVYIQNRYGAIICPSVSLHVVHFYRICYQFHDVLIVKSALFVLLLKVITLSRKLKSVLQWPEGTRVAHPILQRYMYATALSLF